MSASVSATEYQKSKGHGNSNKPSNGKFPSGPKDYHSGDREDVDSWRNQQAHHQAYSNADQYLPSPYTYGAFPYTGGFDAPGPWSSNGGGDVGGFVGGYSQPHESGPPSGHYNNVDNGMFGNGSGGYGNFAQPAFSYGFPGSSGAGDYNAWGQPRNKGYDDYYRDGYGDDRGMKMIDSMGALSLNERKHSLKDSKDLMGGGGSKKSTTWASIASQPAKPQSLLKKKTSMGGMPPPPIMLGAWEKNGSVPKAPIGAPVQAPHPPAWERMDRVVPKGSPPPALPVNPILPPPQMGHGHGFPPNRGYHQHQSSHGNQMSYNQSQPSPQSHSQPPPLIPQQQSHYHRDRESSYQSSNSNNIAPPTAAPAPLVAKEKAATDGPQYPDEAKMKSDYNPSHFDLSAEGARFFVIKSYSEDDIHRSIKYEIWCSTEHGNKRLDQAWREREGKGPIYLFFSVNSSGHFCGMAQMMSNVDYEASSSVWCQDKWKGQFKVKWVYVKDVPNGQLRHIRLENNENKSVTNSRDTQEVPLEKGKQVLKILHAFHHTTSIFDDFVHYEKRQEEEDQRKTISSPTNSPPNAPYDRERNDRGGGGRGGYQNRGGNHHNDGHHPRDRDFNNYSRDNPRGDHYHRGDQRDGQGHGSDRGFHRGGMRGSDRGHYGGGSDRGFDRGGDRDFYRDRGDRDRPTDHRGGSRGGGRGAPRN